MGEANRRFIASLLDDDGIGYVTYTKAELDAGRAEYKAARASQTPDAIRARSRRSKLKASDPEYLDKERLRQKLIRADNPGASRTRYKKWEQDHAEWVDNYKENRLADFRSYHRDRTRERNQPTNHPYKYPINEQFDCVISNPPFSIKEDARTLAQYQTRFAYAEWKNSENLFIERWYQYLKEGGRLGVVLPDSVFDTNENLYIRMFLYRFFDIRAVVSLPVVSFQPYTPTKTSLLFARKKAKKEVDAWDNAWRKAANEYGKVRGANVVQYVLKNNRIRSALIDLASKADLEWYPSTSVLTAASLPADFWTKVEAASQGSPTQKRRCQSAHTEFDELTTAGELVDLEKSKGENSVRAITQLLRDRFPKDTNKLKLSELVETAYDEIVEATDLNYTEDPKGQNYCNAWWCFAEVASQSEFQTEIFFAEAEQVGYKRTTRHPAGMPRSNDLFAVDETGQLIVGTEDPKTILDALRKIHVFSR